MGPRSKALYAFSRDSPSKVTLRLRTRRETLHVPSQEDVVNGQSRSSQRPVTFAQRKITRRGLILRLLDPDQLTYKHGPC